MISGQSSQRGITFVDSEAEGQNAVYCCYQNDEIVCLTGRAEEIKKLFKSEMDSDKVPGKDKKTTRTMVGVLLIMVLLLAWAIGVNGAPNVIVGVVVFAIVGSFPLFALASMDDHQFEQQDTFEQLKRNHGAEHVILAYHRKHIKETSPAWSIEELRKSDYIDPECGTVYLATLLVWSVVVSLTLCCINEVGLGGAVGIIIGSALLLIINAWFNPFNPLKLFQLRMVARPGDRELYLAAAGMQKLMEITKKP